MPKNPGLTPSSRRGTPAWRRFEQLVARIEKLAGNHAVVRSPDKIPDKTNGDLRDVDVSIRSVEGSLGSAPILITVECRKRKDPEDVTWIEQLASKRQSIGAHLTIAVSDRGFSELARAKARDVGIVIREIQKINDDEILRWLSGSLQFIKAGWKILDLQVKLDWVDDGTPIALSDRVLDLYTTEALTAPLFQSARDGEAWSLDGIIESILGVKAQNTAASDGQVILHELQQGGMVLHNMPVAAAWLAQQVPRDQGPAQRTLLLEFPRDSILIETTQGMKSVLALRATVEVNVITQPGPPFNVVSYKDGQAEIMRVAEIELPDETQTHSPTVITVRLPPPTRPDEPRSNLAM